MGEKMSALSVETPEGIEVYYSEIHQALQGYIDDRKIEDMSRETQNKWNAALIYVYNTVFKNTDKLKRSNYATGNLMYGKSSNNNAYDINIVNMICDYYIALCYEYDKEVSINGFSKMTGISTDCICAWGGKVKNYSDNFQNAGAAGLELHKKLTDERQESLSGMLISGKRPPVAILGALNRWYGWNMGQPQNEKAEGLPDQTAADIAARHRISGQAERPQLPDDL